MKKVILKIDKKNIPIFIGDHIITKIDFSKYIKGNDVVIITNKVLAKLHLDKLKKSFKKFNLDTFVLPDGEKYKDINSFTKIHDFLIKNKYGRDLTIIAFGGGVIGDLASFSADTFHRGVNLIHIPTTLLAQVDSSVGGKSGINHSLGKNLIGSFKHPEVIIMDTSYHKTLPKKEFVSGIAEVIKYGIIGSKTFLKWLNTNAESILMKKNEYLVKLIYASVKAKSQVVQKDEKESGIRAYLNYGHTLGHAIESSKKYKGILHGEAVSIGMTFASFISAEKSTLSIEEFNLIENTLIKFGLPVSIPHNIPCAKIIKHIDFDKKKKQGKNNFVLLNSIGKCYITNSLDIKYIEKSVKSFQN